MKRLIVLCLVAVMGLLLFSISDAKARQVKGLPSILSASDEHAVQSPQYGNLPLYFIPNKGQVHQSAKFYARTPQYTLWMTTEGLVFDTLRKTGDKENTELKRDVSRIVFPGANKNPQMFPVNTTDYTVNYLQGNDPSQWKTGIPASHAVLYENLYKNIDLKIYGIQKKIEYDWIVKPGGNPADIRIEYHNVNDTRLDENGDLVIKTGFGELIHKKPVAYQGTGVAAAGPEHRTGVDVAFKQISSGTYGFKVGEYDKNRTLIIDPVIMTYSTLLGGSSDEHAFALAVDSAGCAYVTGDTYSSNFPVKNYYQNKPVGGTYNVYVTKFSASGKSLIYSTYLSGSANEAGEGIQVDSSGRAYITGFTESSDFPTKNAYQPANAGGETDAFLTILSSTGSSLVYSGFLGGSAGDVAFALDIDGSGNIYVTGRTGSSDFPTYNAYRDTKSTGDDAFVTKFTSYGAALGYSTYLGANGIDEGYGIAVKSNNAYIVGRTTSTNFPRQNEYQGTIGGSSDAFLTKLSTSGSSLIYSTYLGGTEGDFGYGIDVDSSGCAYITGDTYSTNFPVTNAYQWTHAGGGKDAFITKFSATGTTLVYSTYLGGRETDAAAHITLSSNGSAFVTGFTQSSDFPVKRAYSETYNGNFDAFVAMLSSGGTSLNFSTFLGGADFDTSRAVALDNDGNVYVAGYTESSDFPYENGYDDTLGGTLDAFVAKFSTYQFGTICGGVDNCDLTFTTGGDANWFEQTDEYYYDGDAVQSGAIGDSESTYFQTTVTGPGTLSFYWQPSSSYSDYLKFYIDNVEQSSTSGAYYNYWTQMSYNITTGTHTLKWSYEKNSYYSYGEDCGWVDKIVYNQNPEITVDRDQLAFGSISDYNSGVQTFTVSSGNAGTLNWTATVDKNWLNISPESGTGTTLVYVSAGGSGLASGTYKGNIIITDPNAVNSPFTVSVTLKVYKNGQSSVPFGDYSTPLNGATISSSVPFTGWALDDLGVESVKIYRHEGTSLVYIGDALFVEGARPDVEAAYPGYPLNYKAGWGYMMLTNFLPNNGNGTFTIDAIATDLEGHQVTLGSKTVTVDNANAVKPFGAIDTPAPGAVVYTSAGYRNHGWVLTPLPNSIPIDGSTINVIVDGVNLGQPTYNIYREDIATLFPNYNNSQGAHAYFDIDPTAYSSGIHTIAWSATDDAGNVDGIGSRYFMIQDSGFRQQSSAASVSTPVKQSPVTIAEILEAPVNCYDPVVVQRGFGENAPMEMAEPDDNGIINVTIRELERLVIKFNSDGELSGWLNEGYRYLSLPVGSTLDSENGVFYWQPGAGFYGRYLLVFIEKGPSGRGMKKIVNVTIVSKSEE